MFTLSTTSTSSAALVEVVERVKDHPQPCLRLIEPRALRRHERLKPSDSLLCDGQLDRGVRPRPRRGRPEGQELVKDSVLDLQLPGVGSLPAASRPDCAHRETVEGWMPALSAACAAFMTITRSLALRCTHSVAGVRASHQRRCSQTPAAWPKGFWAAFPAG